MAKKKYRGEVYESIATPPGLDVNIVKSISAGWHPSSRTLTVTLMNEDGSYLLCLFPGKVCDSLESTLRRVREGYLPWIDEYFTPVSDDTWKCKECSQLVVGTAENGGLVYQLQKHCVEKHNRSF